MPELSGLVTYPEVGASLGDLPAGYRHVERRVRVGAGSAAFDHASECVLTWAMHRGAGLTVDEAQPRATVGDRVESGFRLGPLRLTAPCVVVAVVDRPDARGFAYGTAKGHPASGEESFVVRHEADGSVWLEVRAFSRQARWFSRLGAPVSRLLQRRITDGYVRAVTRACARPV